MATVIPSSWPARIHRQGLFNDNIARWGSVESNLSHLDLLVALRKVTTGAHRGQQVDDEGENVTRENKSDDCNSQYLSNPHKRNGNIPHSRIAAAFLVLTCLPHTPKAMAKATSTTTNVDLIAKLANMTLCWER